MPDLAPARPVSGEPIATAWGTAIHDMLEGIQCGAGSVTITASNLSAVATITFPRAYAAPPIVFIGGTTGPHYNCNATAPPVSGNTVGVHCRRTDGSSQSGTLTFTWLAIGDLATPG